MNEYAQITEPYRVAMFLIREAIGDLFGPAASLCSEEAVLQLYGPEPVHEAEAVIASLYRLRSLTEH